MNLGLLYGVQRVLYALADASAALETLQPEPNENCCKIRQNPCSGTTSAPERDARRGRAGTPTFAGGDDDGRSSASIRRAPKKTADTTKGAVSQINFLKSLRDCATLH